MEMVLGSTRSAAEGRLTRADWFDIIVPKLVHDPESGCWRWIGAHTGEGYGTVSLHGYPHLYVHRVAYTIWNGPIEEGLVLDHVAARGCRHRDCAHPGHLEAVTRTENANVRGRWANRVAPTHCPKGHAMTPANTVDQGPGRPFGRCRRCVTDRQLTRYHARRAAGLPR